jgi:peroxiredoxin family protein
MLDETTVTQDVRALVQEEVRKALERDRATRRATFIASKGTLDWAYPPLILATTAAAAGMETAVFFTFYGLNIIHRDFERKLKVDPVGNPAMPMPVRVPDVLTAMPGMVPMATAMMKKRFAGHNVATIGELLDAAREAEVRLIACQMTMEVFGYEESEFMDGVEFGGAATALSQARRGHVTMFI